MFSPTKLLLLVVLSTLFFDVGAITKPFDFRYALRSDLYIVFEDFDASKLEHALNLNDTADVANEISNMSATHASGEQMHSSCHGEKKMCVYPT